MVLFFKCQIIYQYNQCTFYVNAGYTGSRTNFAYCPPNGEYGTIEAYVWNCAAGPSGEDRGKVPYWSNPAVELQGVATGSDDENNALFMIEGRAASAAAGTNCLDGNPDEAWMKFESGGVIGNNCPNGEASYEHPLSASLGKFILCIFFIIESSNNIKSYQFCCDNNINIIHLSKL